MDPVPVGLHKELPRPDVATVLLCTKCRIGLLYQRMERPRYPRHFFYCRQCGRRYAAWEWGWEPYVQIS